MARRKGETESDVQRVARWRDGLIEDLGPDLRQCVRWMHDADPAGCVVVLRSMRRCCVPEAIQQGVSLYWVQLTLDARQVAAAAAAIAAGTEVER